MDPILVGPVGSSGHELYLLAWQQASCNAKEPEGLAFELRTVNWDAEDEGRACANAWFGKCLVSTKAQKGK